MTIGSHPQETAPLSIAIIGGGICGLAAAYKLTELSHSRSARITLFEASSRVGGAIQTERIDGCVVERAADMFITNKPGAISLCHRLGLDDQIIPTDDRFRKALVLRKGRPLPVPEGFTLIAPTKIWPVLKSRVFSPFGKLRMGLEYFLPARKGDQDESLAAFVRRRFGREVLDRLVQPLVGGIYTSDPEKLSLIATMDRFREMEREHGSLIRASRKQRSEKSNTQSGTDNVSSGARYGMFVTLRDGLSALIDKLSEVLKNQIDVRLNAPVDRIRRLPDEQMFEVRQQDGRFEKFDRLIVAAPTFHAAAMLAEMDNELSQLLNRIEYASSVVAVTGHKLSTIDHPLDAFGLVIPFAEKRRVLAVSFSSRKFAGRAPVGCVQLRTFVGGAMQPELYGHSDSEILELVQDELQSILGVRSPPEYSIVVRHDKAMPQYHVGHVELVEQIQRQVASHAGLALAGNAYHGVGIPDCIQGGEQAAMQVFC